MNFMGTTVFLKPHVEGPAFEPIRLYHHIDGVIVVNRIGAKWLGERMEGWARKKWVGKTYGEWLRATRI